MYTVEGGKEMKKCSIYGQKCGFFESYHRECKTAMMQQYPRWIPF